METRVNLLATLLLAATACVVPVGPPVVPITPIVPVTPPPGPATAPAETAPPAAPGAPATEPVDPAPVSQTPRDIEPPAPAPAARQPGPATWTRGVAVPYGLGNASAGVTLRDGRVLVVGGFRRDNGPLFIPTAGLWHPDTGAWTRAPDMLEGRGAPKAVLLASGKVLVSGGRHHKPLASAEIFDPQTMRWTPTSAMNDARVGHSLLRLSDGRVLAVGGESSTAEIWSPRTGQWTRTGDLVTPRYSHAATLLGDGRVLIVGGSRYGGHGSSCPFLRTGEVWDPRTGLWSEIAPMATDRAAATATLLPSGKVLVAAGMRHKQPGEKSRYSCWIPVGDSLVWDPLSDAWSSGGELAAPRSDHRAVALPDGQVLVVGGTEGASFAEIWSPARGRWGNAGSPGARPYSHILVLLNDGRVLMTGGHRGITSVWSPAYP